jgi:hypothetical protein
VSREERQPTPAHRSKTGVRAGRVVITHGAVFAGVATRDAGLGVRHHGVRTRSKGSESIATASEARGEEDEAMKRNRFPPGWNEARVQRLLAHYERQSDAEAVAEDEAGYRSTTSTAMKIPVRLVPAVRALLAKRRAS